MSINQVVGYLDPEATKINVAGLHRLLIEMDLLCDGSLEESDVVFCEWPRYEYFRELRRTRNLTYRLNQIPEATEQLQHKKRFTQHLKHKPYVLKTYLGRCFWQQRGTWVEKPYNLDRGEGITFLKDPKRWRRKEHLLQRYLDDPWLIEDRKTEVRLIALIDGQGAVRVYREGLVRVAHQPYTLASLDPMIHNANAAYQERMGVETIRQHLLSNVTPNNGLIDKMIEIVEDTIALLRHKHYFGGDDFEAMGYDFVVDRSGTPYLIEANRFPGLYFDHDVCIEFYTGMIRELYRDL